MRGFLIALAAVVGAWALGAVLAGVASLSAYAAGFGPTWQQRAAISGVAAGAIIAAAVWGWVI